ncbi:hypothetical protein [Acidiferrimicrobium sp. IK]|uniref:hypothetical protein n=1 Tax=Acidiferrimicrobium sp. IK TaxID=2871700 RepID=UPI0039676C72
MALSNDLAPHGVTANVVLPGYTPDTELFGDGLSSTCPPRCLTQHKPDHLSRPEAVVAVAKIR